MGERTPEGRGSSLWTPFSGGVVWGEVVLLTGYLACGPHIERPVTARPPAGRAGDVGRYPLGEGREEPFGFPLSPPVNKPLLPPARAGGRAMRRWSLRPQARPQFDQLPSPIPPTREWGSKGKEPPSPWCSFPYFFKEIGPRLGSQGSRPFQRCEKTLHPHPGRLPPQPPAQTKNTAVPHRLRRCFFSARRKRPPQSPISRSRFTISTALRAQS